MLISHSFSGRHCSPENPFCCPCNVFAVRSGTRKCIKHACKENKGKTIKRMCPKHFIFDAVISMMPTCLIRRLIKGEFNPVTGRFLRKYYVDFAFRLVALFRTSLMGFFYSFRVPHVSRVFVLVMGALSFRYYFVLGYSG